MALGVGIAQRQTAGMAPEHILGKGVLKMNLQELQEFVQAELAENPALVLEEERACPVCGADLLAGVCPTCGARAASEVGPPQDEIDEWQDGSWLTPEGADDIHYEPFARVAAPSSLEDHLKQQIRTVFHDGEIPAAEFMVGCLDEDGYLREPLFDIAKRFGRSVPELEAVLERVQRLDPPGIAARSLQECLLVQLRQFDADCADRRNAEALVTKCWDSVCRMRLDDAARQLGTSREALESALRFIRDRLNPRPTSMFRDPWQALAPRREARLAPDVVIRETETGFAAEVVDPVSNRIAMDSLYASLYAEMSRNKNALSEEDRERVRESVMNARSLIEALEFRRTALRKVAEELLRCQEGFFTKGPMHLKPMTKKQLAQRVGLHESTVCRATNNKMMRLPTGEVIPLEVLFDSALPTKELVKQLAAERLNGRPLSDSEIAERLQSAGIQIARRTVAKYRDQMRVLAADFRL